MSKEIQQAATADGKEETQRCISSPGMNKKSSSPYRRNRNPKDLEAGSGEGGEEYDAYDPFDIVRMKSASVVRLERCRKEDVLNCEDWIGFG
nr:hypothetical protein [Tanacetum cinerariifolium]